MPRPIWAGGSTDNPGDYFKNGDVGMYFSRFLELQCIHHGHHRL